MFPIRLSGLAAAVLTGAFGVGGCTGSGPPGHGDGDQGEDESTDDSGGSSEDGSEEPEIAAFDVEIELASDVNSEAPGTVGIVRWSAELDDITEAFLEFGLDTDYGMVAPVDLAEQDHRALLLGLKPDRTYHLRVVAVAGGEQYRSDDHTIQTGAATNLINLSEFDVFDEAAHEPGFILTTNWDRQGDGAGSAAFIIDADGEVVWWYQSSIGAISAARMSADAKNLWMVTAGFENVAIERVSMDTLDSQVYPDLGAPSHDITSVTGDVMAYLDYAGTPNHSIVEIDSSGHTRIVSVLEEVTIEHSNALRYSPEEDLYIYSDWQQDVFAIHRSDGSIAWSLSDIVPYDWGPTQHGAHLLEDSIVIFANNGAGNEAAAFEYSRTDGSLLLSYGTGLLVTHLGDVQRLPGGNTLVTCATTGRIHEVDAQANLVMSIRAAPLGYAQWRQSLYGPPQGP